MSIFLSKRILPSNKNDDTELQYLRIPGVVMNNQIKSITGEDILSAPSLGTVRNPIYDPPNVDHEIQLLLEAPTKSPLILTKDSNTNNDNDEVSVYYLPSAVASFHNLVKKNLCLFPLNENTVNLFGSTSSNDDDASLSYSQIQDEENNIYSLPLSQDGLCSALYSISLNNTYQDHTGETHYTFIIHPFVPRQISENEIFSTTITGPKKQIYSTRGV